MKKAILVKSDGYSIRHEFFNTIEEARHKMVSEYGEYDIWSFDQEYADLCFCGDNEATVYNNGECVYTWAVIELPSPPKKKLYYIADGEIKNTMSGDYATLLSIVVGFVLDTLNDYEVNKYTESEIYAALKGEKNIADSKDGMSVHVEKDYVSFEYDENGCESIKIEDEEEPLDIQSHPCEEKLYYVEDNTVKKVFTGSHEQLVQKMCELLVQACAEYDIDDISKEEIAAALRGDSHISEDDGVLSFYVIKDYASLQTYDESETFEIKESIEECLE